MPRHSPWATEDGPSSRAGRWLQLATPHNLSGVGREARSFTLSYRVGSAVIVREHPARWGLTSGSVVVLQSVAVSGTAFLGLRGGGKKRRVEDSDKFAGLRDKFSTPPPISEYSEGVVPPTPPPRKKPATLICRPKPKRMPIKRPAASPVLRPKSKAKAGALEVVDVTGGDPDPLAEEVEPPSGRGGGGP